jgi:hypothetical protein
MPDRTTLRVLDSPPLPAGPPDTGGFLFVPVSGPEGAGEYHRTLALAEGIRRRWPDAPVHFLLHRAAPYAARCPFPCTLLEDSPTRDVGRVLSVIEARRPEVVIFDSAGRLSQMRAAARVGALRIYVSSRPKTRWKGFKLDRLAVLDEHWLVAPEFLGQGLGHWERAKLWLYPRVRIRFLATFFDRPAPDLRPRLLARLGLTAGAYVLCCPGGGGQFAGLKSGPAVYAAVARSIAATGTAVLLVGASAADAPGVVACDSLTNAELMAAAGGARLCVINGGSLLIQCLAQPAACVAAPIAADQKARVEGCARLGVARASDFSAEALAAAAIKLLADPAAIAALRDAAGALALRNGVDVALDALDQRLSERARSHAVGRSV